MLTWGYDRSLSSAAERFVHIEEVDGSNPSATTYMTKPQSSTFLTKKLYEEFHAGTKSQSHLINERNFTYRIYLSIINPLITKDQNVLDIGCGSGTMSFYLASKVKNVLGIDISKNAIEACSKSKKVLKINNVNFRQMVFPKEYPQEKFDLIVCFEVIEHLEDDLEAIEKIYELLNKNGLLILSTPSKNAPLHRLGYTKKFDKKVGHLRRYSTEDLFKIVNKAGFQIIEVHKKEGVLRNFLFLNNFAGQLIRIIKHGLSDVITFMDNFLCRKFGESDIIVISRKL